MLSFSLLLFCAWKMSNELKIWNEILFYIQKLNKRKIFGESFRNKDTPFQKKKKKIPKLYDSRFIFPESFPICPRFSFIFSSMEEGNRTGGKNISVVIDR